MPLLHCSDACAIPDGDSVLVTGGPHVVWQLPGSAGVRRYSRHGWVEDLPDMEQGRRLHACAAFTREEERVSSRLRTEHEI